ncbi:hypothetical protein JCM16358_10750 [Halanaerocella petrolearia]
MKGLRDKFKDLNIGTKYVTTVILISLLFIISTVVIYNSLVEMEQEVKHLKSKGDLSIKIEQLKTLFISKKDIASGYIVSKGKDSRARENFISKIEKENVLLEEIYHDLSNEKLKNLFTEIVRLDKNINQIFNDDIVSQIKKEASYAALWRSYSKISTSIEQLNIVLNKFNTIIEQQRIRAIKQAERSVSRTTFLLLVSIFISISLGVLLVYLISRYISRNLQQVIKVSKQIAAGNLDVSKLDYCYDDEIGQLSSSINGMIDNLRDVLGRVIEVAGKTSATSQQLSATSEETSSSITEVSASATEFINTTEELASLSGEIATEAHYINHLAEDGFERIRATEQEIQQILETSEESSQTIDELNDASEEIESIINIISNISERINLLALNASIEAARAGRHGQGFNVVAEEIRNLASQTQDSIDGIRQMIKKLVNRTDQALVSINKNNAQIKDGAQKLDQSKNTFTKIVANIEHITEEIEKINQFSQQVSKGSGEISHATEEQSIAMQQISNSADDLSTTAQKLNELIQQFQL